MSHTPNICFYFQVHQPYRLRDLRVTDIGHGEAAYFDDKTNSTVFRKVAEKCYLPANALILDLVTRHPGFSVAYSLSGVFLDQCEQYGPDVLESFRKLAATGKVEFLAETYYHSLSSIKSLPEFCAQVRKQSDAVQRLFGQTPQVFRNTELIYRNEIAQVAQLMGFKGIISEGADRLLKGQSPNEPFVPPAFELPAEIRDVIDRHFHGKGTKKPTRKAARLAISMWNDIVEGTYGWFRKPAAETPAKPIHVLLKNYRLSDDVAFRFSDKSWIGFPLDAETFTDWLAQSGGHNVNLFMDYETFGEHQWESTGIFEFLRALPSVWERRGITAATPSQVIDSWADRASKQYDAHDCISWADSERDLSAWLGNGIQHAAFDAIYALEDAVKKTGNPEILESWRKLQTSDHFYYMSTKFWADGDVHKYFSPYDSPYEAYRRYSHALCDLRSRLGNGGQEGRKAEGQQVRSTKDKASS
jgi:alpha-amylase